MFVKKDRFTQTEANKSSFISHYFHGNISAQLGRIITEKDVERKRKEVTSYVL